MKKTLLFTIMITCLTSLATVAQEKKDDYPKTKISGLIFGDYYFNLVRDTAFSPIIPDNAMTGNNALSGKQNEYSVQVRRIYFTFDHAMAKNVEARFRLEADPSSKLPNNKLSTFVKAASIKWNYFKGHDLFFGLITNAMFEAEEDCWGHRFIEKTITDLRGIFPSSDFGIALKGKIDSLGKIKYSAMFGEGTGVVPSNIDWYKTYYFNLQYAPILELNDKKDITKALTLNFSVDFNEKPTVVNSYYNPDGSKGASNFNGNASTYSLFAGYKVKDKYSFGLEFYFTSSKSAYKLIDTTTAITDPANTSKYINKNGTGFSVWGSYQINEKIGAVVRYDYFEPNNHNSKDAKGDTRHYIIAGATYAPAKKFIISPNVLVEMYENKITYAHAAITETKFKSSITPRLTLSYNF